MKLIESLKQRITHLLTAPGEELGNWARLLQFQIRLWRFCIRRLRENNVLAMSAALSFRTIFAMVPTLVLAFLMLKSLGVVEDSKQVLRNFLTESGFAQIVYVEDSQSQSASAPDFGELSRAAANGDAGRITLAEKIESVIEHVEGQLTIGRLGPIGAALLIWTALTLLTTMERCLNRIFEASRSRSFARRILLYWSALTLGPLALIAAKYAGEKVVAAAWSTSAFSWLIWWVGWIGPIVVGVMLLAGLYSLMPNTRVRFRSALEGAVVAVPIWLLARWAFALYVENVGRQSIYGVLGLIPLFLLWLNLSWWIFLFGAELAHTAANLSVMQSAEERKKHLPGPWDLLAAVVAIARVNATVGGPAHIEEISAAMNLSAEAAEGLLGRLASDGFVCRVADEQAGMYLLARPAERMRVSDILQIGFPYGDGGPAVAEAVMHVRRRTEAGIEDLTIAALLKTPK